MDQTTNAAHSDKLMNSVPRYSYYALAVLTLVNFLNYIDRQIFPTVFPLMTKELKLSDTEFGAMEAALLLSFTVLAPLFGRLGDKRSRTKLMASAAVIWSIATAVTGFADRMPFMPGSLSIRVPIVEGTLALSGVAILLCIARAVVGVGESSYSTITPSLIADYFPLKKRATALGIFQAAIPMGFALGYVIGAVLAKYFGWRMAFMIVGVPGLVTAFFVWTLKEPARGATELRSDLTSSQFESKSSSKSFLATAREVFTTRDWVLSTAGYTALTFVLGAFATWSVLLLSRDKGMTPEHAAEALGLVTLLGGATGTFGGGWIADRVASRRKNGYWLVCAASSALGFIPTIVALASTNPYIFLPAVFLAVMFLFVNNAPFHAILVSSVLPTIRATAVALNIVVIHIMGDVISRFGVGVVSDSIAVGNLGLIASAARVVGINPTTQHLSAALLLAPVSLIVSSLFFAWGGIVRKRNSA